MLKKIMLALITLLIVGFIILLNSSLGIRVAIWQLNYWLPGHISYQQVSGRLLSHVEIIGAQYQYESQQFFADKLILNWRQSLSLNYQGQIQWDNVSYPLNVEKKITTPDGVLQFDGNLSQISLQINGKLFNSDTVISGLVHWSEKIFWQFKLNSTQLSLGEIFPNISSELNLDADYRGDIVQDNIIQKINLKKISGHINQQPVLGQVQWDMTNSVIDNVQGKITADGALLALKGSLTDQWAMQWDVNIPQLKRLFPQANGKIISAGSLLGPIDTPEIKGKFTVKNLKFGEIVSQSAQGDFQINTNLEQPSQLNLEIDNTSYPPLDIKKFTLKAAGKISQMRLTLNAITTKNITVNLAANTDNKKINFSQFEIRAPKNPPWLLQKNSTVDLNQHKMMDACLQQDAQHQFCLAINKNRQDIQMNLRGKAIPLALANPMLSIDDLALSGGLDFLSQFNFSQGKLSAAKFNFGSNKVTLSTNLKDSPKNFDFYRLKIHGAINEKGLQSDGEIFFDNKHPIKISLKLPQLLQAINFMDQSVNATLDANINDLSLLAMLSPYLKNLNGDIKTNLQVSGTMNKPSINGNLSLLNGQLDIPRYGINLKNINAQITGDGQRPLILNGKINYNGTPVTITAETDLSQINFPTKARISADKILVVNNEEYQVYLIPNIQISADLNGAQFGGDVVIPEAHLTPRDFSQTETLSDDVVFINDIKPNSSSRYNLSGELAITLGDQVSFIYSGLNSFLSGNIHLIQKYNRTTATGEINMNKGKVTAFRQTLDITQGKLVFTGGSIENPGLNITASKSIKGVVSGGDFNYLNVGEDQYQLQSFIVGVNILGTARRYQINLFSRPASLSQADILSYMLTGRPISQAGNAGGELVLQAALSMNFIGGSASNLTDDIKKSLGLDTIEFSTENKLANDDSGKIEQQTSLELGKYLTPKLYISYNVGLTDVSNLVRIRYLLSPSWSAQAETGDNTSGTDIFYNIEVK